MTERIVIIFDPIFDSISYKPDKPESFLELFYAELLFNIFLCDTYETLMNMKAKRICKHVSNYIER